MTVKLNKGTGPAKIYNALLTHEYMSKQKIAEKSGVSIDSLSGALTKLRRAGLAKHNNGGQNRMWKKFSQSSPMYPPQEDSRKRKVVEAKPVKELPRVDTLDEIMDRMITDFALLRDLVQDTQETCAVNARKLETLEKVMKG